MTSSLFFKFSRLTLSLLFILGFLSPARVNAQSGGLYYTVQSGDTLSRIANSFHTTTGRLLTLNYMPDPNALDAGVVLYIPGFEDIQGEAIRVRLPVGESLSSFNKALRLPVDLLNRMNFITNTDEFFAGSNYYVINQEARNQQQIPITAGLSGLELSISQNVNPWLTAEYNALRGPWELIPNEMLYLPTQTPVEIDQLLPGVTALSMSSPYLPQGKTMEFTAGVTQPVQLSGILGNHPLHFFPATESTSVALQGIHRMADPGLTPFVITSTLDDGSTFSVQQNLLIVEETSYGADTPFQVADNYVDPAVTEPEFALLLKTIEPAPPEKTWSGAFKSPSPTPDCKTSTFGRLRSYNGSAFTFFHSGLDYCGNDTTPVYAAASGTVVYTGSLTVRGNATVISHGWGVYTGYWHQSAINVSVGDFVEAGRVIGMVGNTGRVTGPHLHFEVLVGGVQVDPTEWLEGKY